MSAWSQRVITGGADAMINLYAIGSGTCLQTFVGHRKEITRCLFMGGGESIVSGACDQTIRVWDCETGKCLRNISLPGGVDDMEVPPPPPSHSPPSSSFPTNNERMSLICGAKFAPGKGLMRVFLDGNDDNITGNRGDNGGAEIQQLTTTAYKTKIAVHRRLVATGGAKMLELLDTRTFQSLWQKVYIYN